MQLTENVHYKRTVYEPGKWTEDRYCGHVYKGKATVYEVIHPDVDPLHVQELADHHRNLLILTNRREVDRKLKT